MFLPEFADGQPSHYVVMAVAAGYWEAIQYPFRNAIAAVSGHAHGNPVVVVLAQQPVMHMANSRVGSTCSAGQATCLICYLMRPG